MIVRCKYCHGLLHHKDWCYVEWPTNNLGDELFELDERHKESRVR